MDSLLVLLQLQAMPGLWPGGALARIITDTSLCRCTPVYDSLARVVCLRIALRSPLTLGRTSSAMWLRPVSNSCSMPRTHTLAHKILNAKSLCQTRNQIHRRMHTDSHPNRTCSISYIGVSADNLGKSRNGMSRTYTVLAGSTSTSSFDRSRPMMSFLCALKDGRTGGGWGVELSQGSMGGWAVGGIAQQSRPEPRPVDH